MNLVFGALWEDLIATVLLGAIGGLSLGLLQEKGLEMPHWYTNINVKFIDMGFFADVFIGMLAAVIVYALNPPDGALQLIFTTLTAGIGGSAILKSYIKGTQATQHDRLSAQSLQLAEHAINVVKSHEPLDSESMGTNVPGKINLNLLQEQLKILKEERKKIKRTKTQD